MSLGWLPFALVPDPEAYRNGGLGRLCLVTEGNLGHCPAQLEMDSFEEAESACGAFNLGIDPSPQEANELILSSMGSGTA